MNRNLINISLGEDISEKHLDQIINHFYIKFHSDTNKLNTYKFDLSNLKWISNQELLVLTGLFQYLININTNFKVNFLKDGSSANIDKRVAKQIVEIWEVWKCVQGIFAYFVIEALFNSDIKINLKVKLICKLT